MSKNRSARARQNRQNGNNHINTPANISIWNDDWVQRPITANLDTMPSGFPMYTRAGKGVVHRQIGMNGVIPYPTKNGNGDAERLISTIIDLYNALVKAEKTAKNVFGVGTINGYLYDVAMFDGAYVIAVEGETLKTSDMYIINSHSPAQHAILEKIGREMFDGIFGANVYHSRMVA